MRERFTVEGAEGGLTLAAFLRRRAGGLSWARAKRMCERGQVAVGGERVLDPGARLADGQEVRVHNDLGEVRVRLRLNPDVRPGVVFLPKGIWNRHTLNGCVGTALVPDAVSAVSGGACFNDARVEVGPA